MTGSYGHDGVVVFQGDDPLFDERKNGLKNIYAHACTIVYQTRFNNTQWCAHVYKDFSASSSFHQ